MERFWDLFERSYIITGVLSVLLVGGALYMAIQGQTPPDWLSAGVSIILGFFFGQKAGTNAAKQAALSDK